MNINFQLHNHGFELRRQACPPPDLERLQVEFTVDARPSEDQLVELAAPILHPFAAQILGEDCRAIQAGFQSRSVTSEPWHQAVFTLPDGIAPNYDRALILRLCLDECTFFDGSLKLCPSSHKHGVLTEKEVRGHSIRPFSSPEMQAGDLLLIHPLTIHAMAASQSGKPARFIQFLYTA